VFFENIFEEKNKLPIYPPTSVILGLETAYQLHIHV